MIISDLYKALLTKVSEIPEVKYFDYYAGQLDFEGAEDIDLPFNLPAVFVSFRPTNTVSIGNKRQQSDIEIEVLIASLVIPPMNSREASTIRNNSLAHTTLIDSIHAKLHGFNGHMVTPTVNFNSLTRTDHTPFEGYAKISRGAVLTHVCTYRTRVTFDSAMPIRQLMNPQPSLEIIQNMLPDED